MRSKGKLKAARTTRQSSTPVTQSDRLLSADTYIGPLKKKGRPKSIVEVNVPGNVFPAASSQAVSSKDVIIIDGSDTENAISTSGTDHPSYASKKKCPPRRPPPFTTAPLVRCYTDPQQTIPVDGIDLAVSNVPGHCSSSSLATATPNTALLAALSTIDSSKIQGSSTGHNDSNTDLVAALRQLLAVYGQPSTVFPDQTGPTPAHQPSALLPSTDKENMNPTTQRKSAEKGSNLPSDPLRTSPRTNRLNQARPLQASPQPVSAPRKRTLSDFMDEKDKGKTRGRVGRHDASRTASVQHAQVPPVADSMRHYPKVLASSLPRAEQPSNYYRTPLEPWTSPIRGKSEKDRNKHASAAEPVDSRTLKPASPDKRLKTCASSPIRAHKESRRKYVVPEWARTDTATRPRLSEGAQRALKQAEVRRREDRNAARRRLPSMKSNISTINSGITEAAGRPKSPAPQVPIAVSSNGPVVAFPVASPPISSSSPVDIPRTPKTPSKNRDSSTPLFTPMRSGSLFGSASFSHSCAVPLSILTSPIGNRKKMKKLFTPLASSTASTNKDSPNSPTDATNLEPDSSLDNGLERALDEADCPPSSLPIASSDDDANLQPSSAAKVEEEITETEGIKQHWAGLPPSSPPPPSSPMLIPEARMDDEDLDDLPIATSDSEADVDVKTFCHEFVPPVPTGTTNGDSTFPFNLTDEDFTTLFLMECDSPSIFDPNTTSDLFEQFTCMNTPSDDTLLTSPPNNNIQTMVQNGMDTLDFTEFWETFNPMVNANIQASQIVDPMDFGNSQLLPSAKQIDPVKLADEVQALFGGCIM